MTHGNRSKCDQLRSRIDDLHRQQRDAIAELDTSLQIQAVWAQAFDGGKCTTRIDKTANKAIPYALTIVRGDGVTKSFSADAVFMNYPSLLRPHRAALPNLEKHLVKLKRRTERGIRSNPPAQLKETGTKRQNGDK